MASTFLSQLWGLNGPEVVGVNALGDHSESREYCLTVICTDNDTVRDVFASPSQPLPSAVFAHCMTPPTATSPMSQLQSITVLPQGHGGSNNTTTGNQPYQPKVVNTTQQTAINSSRMVNAVANYYRNDNGTLNDNYPCKFGLAHRSATALVTMANMFCQLLEHAVGDITDFRDATIKFNKNGYTKNNINTLFGNTNVSNATFKLPVDDSMFNYVVLSAGICVSKGFVDKSCNAEVIEYDATTHVYDDWILKYCVDLLNNLSLYVPVHTMLITMKFGFHAQNHHFPLTSPPPYTVRCAKFIIGENVVLTPEKIKGFWASGHWISTQRMYGSLRFGGAVEFDDAVLYVELGRDQEIRLHKYPAGTAKYLVLKEAHKSFLNLNTILPGVLPALPDAANALRWMQIIESNPVGCHVGKNVLSAYPVAIIPEPSIAQMKWAVAVLSAENPDNGILTAQCVNNVQPDKVILSTYEKAMKAIVSSSKDAIKAAILQHAANPVPLPVAATFDPTISNTTFQVTGL